MEPFFDFHVGFEDGCNGRGADPGSEAHVGEENRYPRGTEEDSPIMTYDAEGVIKRKREDGRRESSEEKEEPRTRRSRGEETTITQEPEEERENTVAGEESTKGEPAINQELEGEEDTASKVIETEGETRKKREDGRRESSEEKEEPRTRRSRGEETTITQEPEEERENTVAGEESTKGEPAINQELEGEEDTASKVIETEGETRKLNELVGPSKVDTAMKTLAAQDVEVRGKELHTSMRSSKTGQGWRGVTIPSSYVPKNGAGTRVWVISRSFEATAARWANLNDMVNKGTQYGQELKGGTITTQTVQARAARFSSLHKLSAYLGVSRRAREPSTATDASSDAGPLVLIAGLCRPVT
ncbi:hypothetical protein NDU88_005070 [Pleurodeles waltl]|uniref:Uncharacterized protein n=1 Tax=Pleurodeles waltl TaxID=8319 RepID=A0AAV7VM53_PLEWA|nr:hypothetical protein NDU88_005070 [Pleurodeles waltl]